MAEVMSVTIMLISCLRLELSTPKMVSFQQRNIVISAEIPEPKQSVTGEYFADLTNDHLAKAGFAVRVDHRSYKDQKNGLEATTHEGPKATQLRRLGVTTEIILKNDAIKQRNAERIEAPRILKHLEQEIFASEKIVSSLKVNEGKAECKN